MTVSCSESRDDHILNIYRIPAQSAVSSVSAQGKLILWRNLEEPHALLLHPTGTLQIA